MKWKSALKVMLICVFLFSFFIIGCSSNEGEYPTKPIEMIVPFEAGGAADIAGRAAAKVAEEHLGVPIGVQNITGAGGATGFDHIRRANPDGYEICWTTQSILTQTNLGNLQYDYTEWEYVCRVNVVPTAIVVRADAPWETLEDFIEDAKANPGEISIGHAGVGSFTHLVALGIGQATGIDLQFVPSGVGRIPDLLAGQVDSLSVHPPEVIDLYEAGEVRILAFVADERVEKFPDIPLLSDSGYDVGLAQMWGVIVPKGTPREVTKVLEGAFRKAVEDEDVLNLAESRGIQLDFLSYEEYNQVMEEQNELIKALVESME